MDNVTEKSNESLIQLNTTTNPSQNFKVSIINSYISKINTDLYRENNLCRSYKRWLGVSYWINVSSSTMSVVLSSGSLAALTDLISSPIAIPFTCIVAISGMITLVTNLFGHKFQYKLNKHRDLINLMETYQYKLREDIANTLADDLISNEELKTINNTIMMYEKDKSTIRSKWGWKIHGHGNDKSSNSC